MRSLLVTVALCSIGLAAAAATRLGNIQISENEQTGVKDCGGGTATVASNENKLTFKGCSKVSVLGNENALTLEGCKALEIQGNENKVKAGRVSSIQTIGNNNKVTYQPGPKKEKPSISNLGNGNTIQAE